MAPELLNMTERLPSADIFSLGLTIYEMCFTLEMIDQGHLMLPTDGPQWHKLREGHADPIQNRPQSLVTLVQRMLLPEYLQRPTAIDITTQVSEVTAMEGDVDPCLLEAPSVCQSNGNPNNPRGMFLYRSASFQPSLMLSVSTDGSTHDEESHAIMMDLMARAITPH